MIGWKGRKRQKVIGRIFVLNEDNTVFLHLQTPLFFSEGKEIQE